MPALPVHGNDGDVALCAAGVGERAADSEEPGIEKDPDGACQLMRLRFDLSCKCGAFLLGTVKGASEDLADIEALFWRAHRGRGHGAVGEDSPERKLFLLPNGNFEGGTCSTLNSSTARMQR